MANLVSRRPLESISKITSRKNIPEIITFRYSNSLEPSSASEADKVFLADAGDATKNIKLLIIKALHMFDERAE